MSGPAPTRPAPARPPDGFFLEHPRYRLYVLFSATGLVVALDALILLRAANALGEGPEAWASFQQVFQSGIGIAYAFILFTATLFFAIRFLLLGVSVFTVRIGALPAPPAALVLVGQFAGLIAGSALVLLILSGVIL